VSRRIWRPCRLCGWCARDDVVSLTRPLVVCEEFEQAIEEDVGDCAKRVMTLLVSLSLLLSHMRAIATSLCSTSSVAVYYWHWQVCCTNSLCKSARV
jgi:hypothetical protein